MFVSLHANTRADVSITHLTFGREYTQAIEQKQVAQQEAEKHKFIVQKAEQERLVRPLVVSLEVVRNYTRLINLSPFSNINQLWIIFLSPSQAAIIKAEGESESAQLISDATKEYGSAMIEIRRIEVSSLIVHLDGFYVLIRHTSITGRQEYRNNAVSLAERHVLAVRQQNASERASVIYAWRDRSIRCSVNCRFLSTCLD